MRFFHLFIGIFVTVTKIFSNPIPSKVFICYAGVENIEVFQSNYRLLTSLRSSHGSQGYQSNCMVILSENKTKSIGKIVGNTCQITEFYHGDFTEYAKLLTPSLVQRAGYTHVMIIHSSTKFSSYHLKNVLDIMRRNNLSVAIPFHQITGAPHDATTTATPTSVGSVTEILELYSPIFTISAWQCFWDMINPGLNPSGAGYDIYFYHFCSSRMRSQGDGSNQLKIGKLNGMRIGTLPQPIQKSFQRTRLNPVEQLQNWIDYLRNDRGGVIMKGQKEEIEMLV